MRVPAIAVNVPTTTVGVVVASGANLLLGWAFIETTGTAGASLTIFDGSNANGSIVAPISLTSGQSTRDWLGAPGLFAQRGLFVALNSGSIQGALYIISARDETPFLDVYGEVPVYGGPT